MKILFALFISVVVFGCTSASHVAKSQPTPIEPIMINGQKYRPLNIVDVHYPLAAIRSNISGFCTVEFTVAKDGTTKDHKIFEYSNGVFKKDAMNTAKSLRYSPLKLNGALVEITGVKYTVNFEIFSARSVKPLKQETRSRWEVYMSQFCSAEAKKTATEDQLKQCRMARQFLVLR